MSSNEIKNKEPFSFRNFQAATSKVRDYVHLVLEERPNWLGCRYKCPIIWYPTDDYKVKYELMEVGMFVAFQEVRSRNGSILYKEHPYLAYSLTLLHVNHLFA